MLTHDYTLPLDESAARNDLRWAVWLMIVASAATMVARIATVRATTGETPMLSANDRSRWCTVRALVDEGTYAIDSLVQIRHPETKRRFWKTIDMVRHRGPDGREHYYSSKPPLFPTLVAGEYWVIRQATGATLEQHPFQVMRWMLVITNVLPLLLYFYVLQRCVFAGGNDRRRGTLYHDGRHLGHVLDHLRGDAQQPSAGRHLRVAGLCLDAADLERGNQLVVLRGERTAGGVCRGQRVAGAGALRVHRACVVTWRSPRKAVLAFAAGGGTRRGGLLHDELSGAWHVDSGVRAPRRRSGCSAGWPEQAASELDRAGTCPCRCGRNCSGPACALSEQATVVVDKAGQRWAIWDRVGATSFRGGCRAGRAGDPAVEQLVRLRRLVLDDGAARCGPGRAIGRRLCRGRLSADTTASSR